MGMFTLRLSFVALLLVISLCETTAGKGKSSKKSSHRHESHRHESHDIVAFKQAILTGIEALNEELENQKTDVEQLKHVHNRDLSTVNQKYDDLKKAFDKLDKAKNSCGFNPEQNDEQHPMKCKSTENENEALKFELENCENEKSALHKEVEAYKQLVGQQNELLDKLHMLLNESNSTPPDKDVKDKKGTPIVAFNAKVSGFSGSASGFSRISFDIVDLNIGDAYEPRTGIFRAPVPGLYTFSYEILASESCRNDHVCVNLLVNGVFSSGSCSAGFASGGTAVNLVLSEGASVWMVDSYAASCHLLHHDSQYNIFSGNLIRETN